MHGMVRRVDLRNDAEAALVSHFLYGVGASTMDGRGIARAWNTALDDIRKSYGKEDDARFERRANELFKKVLTAVVPHNNGADGRTIKSIIESKRALDSDHAGNLKLMELLRG